MSQHYERIPIPFRQRLREFRVRILPVIVFLCIGMVVYYLWEDRVSAPAMIGEVVADRGVVSSTNSGQLINFYTDQFDYVEEGQLLGQILREDTLFINAQLNLIRSEIELIEQSREPISDEQRNRIDLEDLKIEEMNTRITLAQTRLQKTQARADFNRIADLYERDLASDQEYELAQTEMDLLTVQVEETENLIEYLSEQIADIEEITGYHTRGDRDPVLAAIKVQEQRMEVLMAEYGPVPVYAPISGRVSLVHKIRGEKVTPGDSIISVESTDPAYIIGYVRQPFSVEPERGMEVQVRTRKPGRAFFNSHIEQIGGHIRMIDEQLQRPGAIFESGLPVKVAIREAEDINLTPGEIVDIVLRPGSSIEMLN